MNKSDRRTAYAPKNQAVPAALLSKLIAVLIERREALNRRLDLLGQELPRDVIDGPLDVGDTELVRSQFETTRTHLLEVDAALARIDAGTFGRCVNCDGPVNLDRLEALPTAALCTACAGGA